MPHPSPLLAPLGDRALVVRFAEGLDDAANRAAIAAAARLEDRRPVGVEEIVPSLVSVLVRYDPALTRFGTLCGDIALALWDAPDGSGQDRSPVAIDLRYDGPDLEVVAGLLGLSIDAFVSAHVGSTLRVLATGFAPGFVYCGFHDEALAVPRRTMLHQAVPPGAVLFAARQTAIASTNVPTGWHWIGTTGFRNFAPDRDPPTTLAAGDGLAFVPK